MSNNPIFGSYRAFNLIEILVIITIIAILSAIIFPVFDQAREKARASTCLSNLKQIGLGMAQYTQDYDETICPFSYSDSGGVHYWFGTFVSTWNTSQGLLSPYIRGAKIQDCPDASSLILANKYPVSYGINGYYLYYPNYSGDPSSIDYEDVSGGPISARIVAFDSPADTIMMADNAVIYPYNSLVMRYSLIRPPSESTSEDRTYSGTYGETVHGRHQGSANILWCDGHVKTKKVTYDPSAGALEIENSLGDLINPSYPYGSANQDYYFQLKKP